MKMTMWFSAAIATLLVSSVTAGAAFLVPGGASPVFANWSRSDANSTYAEWNDFSSSYLGANAPDVSDGSALTTPSLGYAIVQGGSPSAFLASGGNIYNPGGASAFQLTLPGLNKGVGFTRVVAQVKTLATPLSDASILLTPAGGGPTPPVYSTLTATGSGFSGVYEYLLAWDLPGNAAAYQIDFAASAAHLSLDAVAVDSFTSTDSFGAFPQPAPEPASLLLLALGALALTTRRGN
jgi:hypothetical protein